MRYRLSWGMAAWLLHRLTGICLTLYIFVHLYILSHLKTPEKYEELMGLMHLPIAKVFEILLLAGVLAHGLNGMRLTIMESGPNSTWQKPLLWAAAAAGLVLLVFGAIPFVTGGGQ